MLMTQFYLSLSDVGNVKAKLIRIIDDMGVWLNSKKLKLNESKTELLIAGKIIDVRRLGV